MTMEASVNSSAEYKCTAQDGFAAMSELTPGAWIYYGSLIRIRNIYSRHSQQ